MSSFEINIPIRFSDADDVKEAFASSYGYSEQIQVGGVTANNPISKEEFVKQKCINFILDVVKTELVKNEEKSAKIIAEQLANERATEVTQWFDNRRLESIGGIDAYQQFPQVNSISIETYENESINFTLTAVDPNNLPVTFFFTTSFSNGSIIENSPEFTYIPNENFYGTDIIKFKANNGSLNSLEASVQIEVKRKIYVQNGFISTRKNQDVEILLNAFNAMGNNISFTIEKNPDFGQITAGNPFIYSPQNNFVGNDSILFSAQDDFNKSNTATYDISIVDLLVQSQNYSVNANDSITIELIAIYASGEVTFNILTQPLNGSLNMTPGANSLVIYTPNNDFVGTDSFEYQATDEYGQSNIATIELNVNQI